MGKANSILRFSNSSLMPKLICMVWSAMNSIESYRSRNEPSTMMMLTLILLSDISVSFLRGDGAAVNQLLKKFGV